MPISSPTVQYDVGWSDLNIQLTQTNRMALSVRYCVNEVKSTLGKGRLMKDRLKEHGRYIHLACIQNSTVSEHSNETGHKPLWEKVKFIDRDNHWNTRNLKVAIHIRLNPNNINRNNRTEILVVWMPTIRKHQSKRATSPWIPEEKIVYGNNSRIEMHQPLQTTVIHNAVQNLLKLSPEVD